MKSILDYPPSAHLRRSRLYEALSPFSFSRAGIDGMIRAGVIEAKYIPHRRRVRAPKASSGRKKNIPAVARKQQPHIKDKAYFVAGDVIAELDIKPALGGQAQKQ